MVDILVFWNYLLVEGFYGRYMRIMNDSVVNGEIFVKIDEEWEENYRFIMEMSRLVVDLYFVVVVFMWSIVY